MTADLTPIIVSAIGAAGTIISSVAVYIIQRRMKDAQLRDVLSNAVRNSVGILTEFGKYKIETIRPQINLPNVPADIAPSVQYVLDHAKEAVDRFNLSNKPEMIAEKVVAQIGLTKLDPPAA